MFRSPSPGLAGWHPPRRRWREGRVPLLDYLSHDWRLSMARSMARHSTAHPGFAAVQRRIEGEGYSADEAGAILAASSRRASPAAKARNPRLKRVRG